MNRLPIKNRRQERKSRVPLSVSELEMDGGRVGLGTRAMRIEALGTHGGEMPGCRATAFRIDGCLALDAGGLASSLSIEEQCRVNHLLITHPHLDHIKDVAFMSDLIVDRRSEPVCLHATPGIVAALRRHFFNNVIWPDFTSIPTRTHPVLRMKEITPLRESWIGKHIVRAIPVSHSVEATGFVVAGVGTTVAFTGDTGPTELFWEELNRLPRLDALFMELSLPNSRQQLANASLHLTPQTLGTELEKLSHSDLPVFLYHLKPAFLGVLEEEIAEMKRHNLRILHDGEVITVRPRRVTVERARVDAKRPDRAAARG